MLEKQLRPNSDKGEKYLIKIENCHFSVGEKKSHKKKVLVQRKSQQWAK